LVLGGRYRLLQQIGAGGIGDVWVAEVHEAPRTTLSREERTLVGLGPPLPRVAVKLPRAEHRGSAPLMARFEREAEAAARVQHPNVLRVLEICMEPRERSGQPRPRPTEPAPVPFFVMELLVGLDLADTLALSRCLVPGRAVRVARGLCAGLGAAHDAGVIHRDVKPENVFLEHAADGREVVKLIDFGFAWLQADGDPDTSRVRITARHSVVGTPEYIAPEQARGATAHPTADVYSLGVVLFEALVGRVPFSAGSQVATARMHREVPVPRLRDLHPRLVASPALEDVVQVALAKDPAHRFPHMAAFATALDSLPEARVS
jgi:serine/threonine-protein kinase